MTPICEARRYASDPSEVSSVSPRAEYSADQYPRSWSLISARVRAVNATGQIAPVMRVRSSVVARGSRYAMVYSRRSPVVTVSTVRSVICPDLT